MEEEGAFGRITCASCLDQPSWSVPGTLLELTSKAYHIIASHNLPHTIIKFQQSDVGLRAEIEREYLVPLEGISNNHAPLNFPL